VEFAGAVYHLLDRGYEQEAIFHEEQDRERFLAALGQVCGRTEWRVAFFNSSPCKSHYSFQLLHSPEVVSHASARTARPFL